ncbi:hypothetical protein CRYUN_Cryun11dG0011600 [Craigia yunnanensis]
MTKVDISSNAKPFTKPASWIHSSSSDEAPETPSSESEGNGDSDIDGFGWKAVLIGYGTGVVFGIAVAYMGFITETNERHRETRN